MAYYWHISMEMNLSWTQEGVLMMMGRKLVAPQKCFSFMKRSLSCGHILTAAGFEVQKYYFFRALVKIMKCLYKALTLGSRTYR